MTVAAGHTRNGEALRVEGVVPGGAVFRLTDDRDASMLRADDVGVSLRVVQRLMSRSKPEFTGRDTKPHAVDIERTAPAQAASSILAATGTDGLARPLVLFSGGTNPAPPMSRGRGRGVSAKSLPTGGDGSSRHPSETDRTTSDDGKSGEVGFAREKTEPDGPGRPVTDSVGSAPRWTRTINPLIKSQRADSSKGRISIGLRLPPESVAAPLPHDIRQSEPADADLAALVEAWPRLPEAIRAGILAMVRTCKP